MTVPSSETKVPSRRKARAIALQVLYEIEGSRHDKRVALESRLEGVPTNIQNFATEIINGVIENLAEIDVLISSYAPNWPLNQIAAVDRNLLRMAICEMLFEPSTPPSVAINEAIELGKVYGGENSPKFVNGVLGSVMRSKDITPTYSKR